MKRYDSVFSEHQTNTDAFLPECVWLEDASDKTFVVFLPQNDVYFTLYLNALRTTAYMSTWRTVMYMQTKGTRLTSKHTAACVRASGRPKIMKFVATGSE